jgi:hypothetical protein
MLLAIQDVGADDQVVRLLLLTCSSHARRIPAVSNCCEHLAPPILGFDKPQPSAGPKAGCIARTLARGVNKVWRSSADAPRQTAVAGRNPTRALQRAPWTPPRLRAHFRGLLQAPALGTQERIGGRGEAGSGTEDERLIWGAQAHAERAPLSLSSPPTSSRSVSVTEQPFRAQKMPGRPTPQPSSSTRGARVAPPF